MKKLIFLIAFILFNFIISDAYFCPCEKVGLVCCNRENIICCKDKHCPAEGGKTCLENLKFKILDEQDDN